MCSLVRYLTTSPDYGGLNALSAAGTISHTLDFLKDYPVKSITDLKCSEELGVFVVNARMMDIVGVDPWWYPVCGCRKIFEKYIGAFHCTKCREPIYDVVPK
jgi:hypothetical protein